ncbi:hypothetical protein SAMN06295974_3812 [Plantibacter flavus]|uniref:Uncharacterized protein n=1 Tax=Plantibacter flavus TaxID=150123 RepID=A0A3N2BL86_9MICO|nr:hypothetical protein [Plantibacter flavus]ROR76041.1 hypothetical protein EDD42_3994 [Plantibacter flavus]SMG49037.1 hypothetical protein SAMN06295974_3812 [Plantibacter flavus]
MNEIHNTVTTDGATLMIIAFVVAVICLIVFFFFGGEPTGSKLKRRRGQICQGVAAFIFVPSVVAFFVVGGTHRADFEVVYSDTDRANDVILPDGSITGIGGPFVEIDLDQHRASFVTRSEDGVLKSWDVRTGTTWDSTLLGGVTWSIADDASGGSAYVSHQSCKLVNRAGHTAATGGCGATNVIHIPPIPERLP